MGGDRRKASEKAGASPCPDCEKSFSCDAFLSRHWLHIHFRKPATKCPVEGCSTQMSRVDHLRRHIRTIHSLDDVQFLGVSKTKGGMTKKWECLYPECDATLSSSTLLFKHIKYDHAPTPISRKAKSRNNDHNCSFPNCSAVFSSNQHLLQHVRAAHKRKPPPVVQKNGTSRQRGGAYNCTRDGCNVQFSRKLVLDQHIKNVHPDEEEVREEEEDATPEVEMEGNVLLCMICCFSFHCDDQESRVATVLKSCGFDKFVREVISGRGQNEIKSPSDVLCRYKNLSVCSECRDLIKAAVGKREELNELERNARDSGEFEKGLVEYCEEMRRIERVVSGGDVSCLEAHLSRLHGKVGGGGGDRCLVRRLREGIITLADKLEEESRTVRNEWGGNEEEGQGSSSESDKEDLKEMDSTLEESKCEHCHKLFRTEMDLASHIWDTHTTEVEFEGGESSVDEILS